MRHMRTTFLTAPVILVIGMATSSAFAQLETQTNASQGVTVKVTPTVLAASAPAWEFEVVLDTHSTDLSDDLLKAAVLNGPAGERIAPIAWEGAASGGHHRKGLLRFERIEPVPSVVELQIQRPGETKPRVFRWELK